MARRAVGLAAALLSALLWPALPLALDPSKAISQYTHDAWTGETDLPQTSVQAILQSRDGYLWLGTQEGLVRFDGVRFAQLNSENVWCLFEDRQGVLRVCTYSGLLTLEKGGARRITTREGLSNDRTNWVCEDASGALWVATQVGLNRIVGDKITVFTSRDGLPADQVACVLEARGGVLWAGTAKGLVRYEGGRFTSQGAGDGLPKDNISRLYEDSEGTLWIGTLGGGLVALKKGRFVSYGRKEGLTDLEVKSLLEDRDGNLWIGTQAGGLFRFRDGRFESYSAGDGLTDNAVWSILEDREGSLWVGTFGGGLNRFKDEKFTTYDASAGLPNNTAWVVYEGSDRTLWIGTDGGLTAFKDGRFKTLTTKDGLPHNSVSSLLEDRDGALWVGTDGGGLARFEDGRFERFGEKEGLSFPHVLSLCEDRTGTLWIGTNGGGLNALRNGRIHAYTKKDGLSDNYVRSLLEDRQGNLWIGTNGGGLNRYRDGAFTALTTADGLPDNFIRSLYQDREGTLWIGTRNGGLCRMRDGKLASFGMKDGLMSDAVFQILEDARGNLWMSCNKGIFKAAKKDLEEFAAGRSASVPCTTYGKADGMKNPECNGGTQPAGWKTRDGTLWFPTVRGAVAVDPQHLRVNEIPPPAVIEEVLVDGKPFSPRGGVAVPPGASRFEFRFTGLSFLAPGKVRFRYRLEGYDGEWTELAGGRERTATYTRLAPGPYTFSVKACNNDGVWNESGASFAFRLKPKFHETWLFYTLMALALLLLGGALYHVSGLAVQNLRVGRSLSRYHSRQVIEKLRNSKGAGALLASERRRITILFSDLAGFSDFSDRNEPEVVNRVINEYLTEMTALLEGQAGTIARFMGDGIMAFFGAPGEMEPADQARRAVAAAVAMQGRMEELGQKWLGSGLDHDLRLRVGISQDYATVGNFGSKDLMEYTALGSAVNLASRLETGCTPGRILVSFPVYVATKERYTYDPPEQREFKGFARPVHVAELDPLEQSNKGSSQESVHGLG